MGGRVGSISLTATRSIVGNAARDFVRQPMCSKDKPLSAAQVIDENAPAGTPLVSVIIPTYNRAHLVGDTVASVLGQTYRNIEAIVIDDGSSDDTAEVLSGRFCGDSRFKYIWQPNSERSVARNRGIAASAGELIAFLDSDDLWHPEKLERQVACFVDDPNCVLVSCAYLPFDEDGVPFVENSGVRKIEGDEWFAVPHLTRSLLERNSIGCLTAVVRRHVFKLVGGFDVRLMQGGAEDWNMWLRASSLGTVAHIGDGLAFYRRHSGNTERPVELIEYIKIIASFYETVPSPFSIIKAGALYRAIKKQFLAEVRRRTIVPVVRCAYPLMKLVVVLGLKWLGVPTRFGTRT